MKSWKSPRKSSNPLRKQLPVEDKLAVKNTPLKKEEPKKEIKREEPKQEPAKESKEIKSAAAPDEVRYGQGARKAHSVRARSGEKPR